MRTAIAVAAAIAATLAFAAAAAGAEPRYADQTDRGELAFPGPACNEMATDTVWLRLYASDLSVLEPVEGQALHSYDWGHVSTVTDVEIVVGADGRTGVAFTATGAGAMCESFADLIGDDEATTTPRYRIAYRNALPIRAWSDCSRIRWGLLPRMVRRNGRVSCARALNVARGWKAASQAFTRRNPYRVLSRGRVRGFRCVHRIGSLTCRRGGQAVRWYARRPPKRKRPPAPIPGPLGWGEAKRTAKRIANNFPIYVERRKVDWCNRWSAWEVHCGVTGWNTVYDFVLEETFTGDICSATAYVTKSPGERAHVRRADDLSCSYD